MAVIPYPDVATGHDRPVDVPLVDLPSLDAALAQLGDRWSLLVVASLLEGPHRYGELVERLPGIAPNVLAARLRALQHAGLVVASPYSRRPVRLSYELSDDGARLVTAVQALSAWGAHRAGSVPGTFRHPVCGTTLELRPWCPTCERVVDPAEADGLTHL